MSLKAVRAVLRSGTWLTPARLRAYPVILGLCVLAALAFLAATSHAGLDLWGRPLGTDFSGVWVAGRSALAGHPAQPYDHARDAAAQLAAFGAAKGYLPWSYPPSFLVVAALLATMPYLLALAVWQGSTLMLYALVVMRAARGAALVRRDVRVAALAFPAVTINLMHGHNGLLSAGLLAGGGLALGSRPLLAGFLFGLLAYKPQFALALPVALIAGAHWRALAATVTTVLATSLATWHLFGSGPWIGFVDGLGFARHVVLEDGGLESYKLQSAFAAVRLWGGSVGLAYGAQALVTTLALGALAILWRGRADDRLKLAGLIVATLLSTPYALDYDMTMLGPALVLMVAYGAERGFPPYGATVLALVWICPLVARTLAMQVGLPVGVMMIIGLFGLVLREAWWRAPFSSDRSSSAA